ncbi:adenosine deaminase [Streptomyces sp. SID6673]|nr:adenosine deaminase [Streptomyces sp. SID11726]NEB26607.1 adenosine deaminase [Streptomyces sp. SID6673]
MPKVEMHLHLDGTLEPAMKLALARRNNIAIPQSSVEEIRESFTFYNLQTFLAVHYSNMDVLWTTQDYEDLCYQYLSTVAAQNVRHVEMFFDPQLHTSRGVPFSDIISGYRRAILRARNTFGMTAELIMCFLRDHTAEHAMTTLMSALPYKDWIIGVGLDSDEHHHPPTEFAAVFDRARREGFQITMHCDVDQVDSIDHIRAALEDLETERIDHGLNILEDQRLVTLARERRIGFTVCPLAYSTHPGHGESEIARIRDMLTAGLLVSIGADDPPYFGGYLGDNLQYLHDVGGFSLEQVWTTQRNAVLSAWITDRRRDELLSELDAYARSQGIDVGVAVSP